MLGRNNSILHCMTLLIVGLLIYPAARHGKHGTELTVGGVYALDEGVELRVCICLERTFSEHVNSID